MSIPAIDGHEIFITSLNDRPLPKHPKFGPFGDPQYLCDALEMLGPLHNLRTGQAPDLGQWKNPLQWSLQGMKGYLWTISQRLNEAIEMENKVGPWNQKRRKGGWKLHAERCGAVASAATELLGALKGLQGWEKTTLESGAAMSHLFLVTNRGLEAFSKQLEWVMKVAKHMETETETGKGNPYVFMHGSASLRLAVDLVLIWNGHPDGRKAKDSRTTDGPIFQFVSTCARFALPSGSEFPTIEAVREAIRIIKSEGPHPYPLIGTSGSFGLDWTEAYGVRKRRVKVTKKNRT